MRDELLTGIEKLCWMFPQLKPSIRYSEVLSQGEVDAFAAFVNGHVKEILNRQDGNAQSSELSALFTCSCGISRSNKKDVVLVESLLSAASGNDMGISSEQSDLVGF